MDGKYPTTSRLTDPPLEKIEIAGISGVVLMVCIIILATAYLINPKSLVPVLLCEIATCIGACVWITARRRRTKRTDMKSAATPTATVRPTPIFRGPVETTSKTPMLIGLGIMAAALVFGFVYIALSGHEGGNPPGKKDTSANAGSKSGNHPDKKDTSPNLAASDKTGNDSKSSSSNDKPKPTADTKPGPGQTASVDTQPPSTRPPSQYQWAEDLAKASATGQSTEPSQPTVSAGNTLAERLAMLNNFYGIKFTPAMEAAGATDSGIPASDGLTYAAFTGRRQAHHAELALLTNDYRDKTVDYTLDKLSHGGYNGRVVAGTSINPHTRVGSLSGDELETLLDIIERQEGITAAGLRIGIGNRTTPSSRLRSSGIAENTTSPRPTSGQSRGIGSSILGAILDIHH